MLSVSFTAVEGIPLIKQGDNLAQLIVKALDAGGMRLERGDIVVICQKVVSKAEGRVYDLKQIEPSVLAKNIAQRWDKDPRAIELVLSQTNRIVRMDRVELIVETGAGWVCANAGMAEYNSI